MRRSLARPIVWIGLAACSVAGFAISSAQDEKPEALSGPVWGRAGRKPTASNEVFATADGCAQCHAAAPGARALTTQLGDDASPHGLWAATPMANSFRDPYFHAQLARECETNPADTAQIESLCFRCHAPMASHFARLKGEPLPPKAELAKDPLAHDGVSCTVCHQAQPSNFGDPASFSGNLVIEPGRTIFGPYAGPGGQPMLMHTAYTPTHGAHISDSALCGSCHTLVTHTGINGSPFFEQAVYPEWLNSDFGRSGTKDDSCVGCHMANMGRMKIARNPAGSDFNIAVRDDVRGHAMVGGNAYLLELYRDFATDLGVTASPESLDRLIRATRAQLAHSTATLTIENERFDGADLVFDIRVENLTGHKFPAGYPSRRAWLNIQVQQSRKPVFESGGFDPATGRLKGFAQELALPHRDVVDGADDVVIYEMTAADLNGQTTTSLLAMASRAKDTRLLPKGWRADGPYAEQTKPIGIDGDADFQAGGDVVHVRAPNVDRQAGTPLIIVRLYYQTIPPAWADGLRTSKTPEAATFLGMYDAKPPVPETVALTAKSVQ